MFDVRVLTPIGEVVETLWQVEVGMEMLTFIDHPFSHIYSFLFSALFTPRMKEMGVTTISNFTAWVIPGPKGLKKKRVFV